MLDILHLALSVAPVAVSEMSMSSALWNALSIWVGGWVVRMLDEKGANPTVDGPQGDRAKVPGIEAPGTE
jgi:hypothetical protein